MKTKISLMLLVMFFMVGMIGLGQAFAAQLPALTFDMQTSTYRKIDKTGAVVGNELMKWAIPGVGVGNVIFSSNPLPVKKEVEYSNVKTAFTYDEVKDGLYARAYYPAKQGDLIKYVKAKYPAYQFVKSVQTLLWYTPDSRQNAGTQHNVPEGSEMSWDQTRYDLLPIGDDSDFDNTYLGNMADEGAGEHRLQLHVFLTFKTGSKYVSKWEGDSYVTREEPTLKDFLISYGEAKITK